jgi:hypothetical protein
MLIAIISLSFKIHSLSLILPAEMSSRNIARGKVRQARKADNIIAFFETVV